MPPGSRDRDIPLQLQENRRGLSPSMHHSDSTPSPAGSRQRERLQPPPAHRGTRREYDGREYLRPCAPFHIAPPKRLRVHGKEAADEATRPGRCLRPKALKRREIGAVHALPLRRGRSRILGPAMNLQLQSSRFRFWERNNFAGAVDRVITHAPISSPLSSGDGNQAGRRNQDGMVSR